MRLQQQRHTARRDTPCGYPRSRRHRQRRRRRIRRGAAPSAIDTSATRSARQVGLAQQHIRLAPPRLRGARSSRLRPHQRRAARHVATHERHQAQHQRIRHSRHNHRRAAPPADDTSATRSARQVGLAQQRLRVALPRFRGRGCSGCAFSHTAAPPATTQRATSTHRDAAANAAVVTTADALRRPPLARPPCAPRAKSDWATTPAPTPTPPSSQPPTHCAERRWHIRRGLRAPGRTCSTTSSRGPVEVSGARLSGMRPKGWSGRQRLVIACRVGVAMSDFPQQRRVVSRWLRG